MQKIGIHTYTCPRVVATTFATISSYILLKSSLIKFRKLKGKVPEEKPNTECVNACFLYSKNEKTTIKFFTTIVYI